MHLDNAIDNEEQGADLKDDVDVGTAHMGTRVDISRVSLTQHGAMHPEDRPVRDRHCSMEVQQPV